MPPLGDIPAIKRISPTRPKHPPHPYSAGAEGAEPGANCRASSVIEPVRALPTPTDPESLTPTPTAEPLFVIDRQRSLTAWVFAEPHFGQLGGCIGVQR